MRLPCSAGMELTSAVRRARNNRMLPEQGASHALDLATTRQPRKENDRLEGGPCLAHRDGRERGKVVRTRSHTEEMGVIASGTACSITVAAAAKFTPYPGGGSSRSTGCAARRWPWR